MDVLMIYAYIAAGLVAILLIQRYIVRVIRFVINPHLIYWFSKHVFLPYLFRRRRFWGPITRFDAILRTIYFAGTFACNIIGVSGLPTARSRAASLAVLHFIPLLVIPQFSLGAQIIGISLSAYQHLHRLFGIMATLQFIIHVAFSLTTHRFDFHSVYQRYGFMAGVALLILFLIMLPWARRWCYELFTKLHCLLSLFMAVAVWLHLKQRFGFDGFCLIISVGLFVLNSAISVLYQMFRNIMAGQPFAVSDVIKHKDAVELTFRPPRPWKARAGQYVYVTTPGLRPLSFAESHPFTVIWWESDPDGKVISISLLAKVEAGFSRALHTSPYRRLRILIDGPYGQPLNMREYASVVAVATGIGIAAQLPYVKEFVEGQLPTRDSQSTSRPATQRKRMLLIWKLQEEYHEDWIVDWMDKLLDEDEKSMALSYSLYVINKSQEEYHEGEKVRISRRGTVFYGKPDLERILSRELAMCHGRLLLTVSADPATRDAVRRYVVASNGIDLYEADYQPHDKKGGFWAPQKPVNHIGIA